MTSDWQQPFRKLKYGMTYEEMVGVVGAPARSLALEKEIHTYLPAPGVEVTVIMTPDLAGVHATVDGRYINFI